MAWSSKVFTLLVVVSLVSTLGQCQRFQSNTSSSSTRRTSPVVTTLAIIGAIIGFVAVIIPVCVFVCYRASKANEERRRDLVYVATAMPSQSQAVYSSYSSMATTTTPQQAPTVVYNASYSHHHNSTGTSGGQQYQSRVLYSIDHQANDSRTSSTQSTR